MEKEEVIACIERFGGAVYDCPFEGDFDSVVLRHADTRRWFGLYFRVPKKYFGEGEGSEFCLNLKCPPPLAAALRENYAAVRPAWHMNKAHWITVRLHGDLPRGEIENLLRLSYDMTARPRAPRGAKGSTPK